MTKILVNEQPGHDPRNCVVIEANESAEAIEFGASRATDILVTEGDHLRTIHVDHILAIGDIKTMSIVNGVVCPTCADEDIVSCDCWDEIELQS